MASDITDYDSEQNYWRITVWLKINYTAKKCLHLEMRLFFSQVENITLFYVTVCLPNKNVLK